MTQEDHWTEALRRKEKADEDRYFAEQDRKLIEKLQRQRQSAQAAKLHETAAGSPAEPTPRESGNRRPRG